MPRRNAVFALLSILALCGPAMAAALDVSGLPDRWFIAPEVWANPWENWRLEDGAAVTCHPSPNTPMTLHLLTHELAPACQAAAMEVTLQRRGLPKEGAAGFALGVQVHDPIDEYRARLLFGEGLFAGVSTEGRLFIGPYCATVLDLPKGFDFNRDALHLRLELVPGAGDATDVVLTARTAMGAELGRVEHAGMKAAELAGNVALAGSMPRKISQCREEALWAFRDWQWEGPKFRAHPERAFGPILWSQYTLSDGVLKLTAQLAPIGEDDAQTAVLEVQRGGAWKKAAEARVIPLSWTAPFRVEGWDDSQDTPYRVVWEQRRKDGAARVYTWQGVVRRDPKDAREVKAALFCCFMDYLFPNRCVATNVARQDPDFLAFVGDQIYENVGGWGILRTGPIDRMCVNYLRKLALWGWSFRDLMKDRPTVTMPDDHDVYQGNIWGDAGREIPLAEWNRDSGYGNSKNVGSVGGYVQPIAFVKAVERTQTSHLPDPACTKSFKQGLTAYFTAMNYGGIGFAILEDRKFKTGPQQIAHRHGGPRPDHIDEPGMADDVNDPNAKLLGDDQLAFLRAWTQDWRGQAMKAAISQTVYCGVATHHGSNDNFLLGDMDSGGWPQAGRRKAVDALRRAGALLMAGDQHLPTIVRHGIDAFGDAMVSFVAPAGAVGYQRWWRPEETGIARAEGLGHDSRPNTGRYRDGFNNLIDVLAVGNPPSSHRDATCREEMAMKKSSGWGLVTFDKQTGAERIEAWRIRPGLDVTHPKPGDQFPGWPMTIAAADNYGVNALKLPPLKLDDKDGGPAPIVRVTDSQGRFVSAGRMLGGAFTPTVYAPGRYNVEVLSGKDGSTVLQRFTGVEPRN